MPNHGDLVSDATTWHAPIGQGFWSLGRHNKGSSWGFSKSSPSMTTRQGRGQGLYNGDQLGEVDLLRQILMIASNWRGGEDLLELARLEVLDRTMREWFLD